MITSNTATDRFANIAVQGGPSPMGAWLKSALRRLVPARARPQPPRDRVREAAELRTWATGIQRTDPRFADDLFAAADRHETMGS
jgi:hypothetical protein